MQNINLYPPQLPDDEEAAAGFIFLLAVNTIAPKKIIRRPLDLGERPYTNLEHWEQICSETLACISLHMMRNTTQKEQTLTAILSEVKTALRLGVAAPLWQTMTEPVWNTPKINERIRTNARFISSSATEYYNSVLVDIRNRLTALLEATEHSYRNHFASGVAGQ